MKEAVKVGQITFDLPQANAMERKGILARGSVNVHLHMTGVDDPNTEFTIGAVDKQKNLVVPKESSANAVFPWSRGGRRPLDEQTFAVLPLDISDVDHYVLLRRPRNWATFESIAAQPKAAPATSPAATRPATRPAFSPASPDANAPAVQPDRGTAPRLWRELGDSNLAKAQTAAEQLVALGDAGLEALDKQISGIRLPSPERLKALIGDLDNDRYDVRQAATKELGIYSLFLKKDLARYPVGASEEAKARIEELRRSLPYGYRTSEDVRRCIRLELVLNLIGTTKAKQRLAETRLASGTVLPAWTEPEVVLVRLHQIPELNTRLTQADDLVERVAQELKNTGKAGRQSLCRLGMLYIDVGYRGLDDTGAGAGKRDTPYLGLNDSSAIALIGLAGMYGQFVSAAADVRERFRIANLYAGTTQGWEQIHAIAIHYLQVHRNPRKALEILRRLPSPVPDPGEKKTSPDEYKGPLRRLMRRCEDALAAQTKAGEKPTGACDCGLPD